MYISNTFPSFPAQLLYLSQTSNVSRSLLSVRPWSVSPETDVLRQSYFSHFPQPEHANIFRNWIFLPPQKVAKNSSFQYAMAVVFKPLSNFLEWNPFERIGS